MALLELDGLTAAYGSVEVLHGISLAVDEGSVVAMLGANGAGKTTTLRAISGMVKTSGRVRFGGKSISSLAPEDVARMGREATARRREEGEAELVEAQRMLADEPDLRALAKAKGQGAAVREALT